MEFQGTLNSQNNLKKKILDFKTYCKATVLKKLWYLHKDRHIGQQNKTENPEINSNIYGQMIFNKDTKTVQWRKGILFYKWCWGNWILKRYLDTHVHRSIIHNSQDMKTIYMSAD